jgi:hypothetical protein
MAISQKDKNSNTSRRRVVESSEWIIAIIREPNFHRLDRSLQNGEHVGRKPRAARSLPVGNLQMGPRM